LQNDQKEKKILWPILTDIELNNQVQTFITPKKPLQSS
jgi:hypothetical protein